MSHGVVRFERIRYATARRFEPPVPVPARTPSDAADTPVEAADQRPVACPQRFSPVLSNLLRLSPASLNQTENCLVLSVITPEDANTGSSLPVMVWVHGGAYSTGAGSVPIYDPALLVSEQNVIVVQVTYRLGVFGFLGHESGVPENLGLLDLMSALEWVRAHIAAFGGNPDLVTLFGQSAGGDAIAHLMIAQGAAHLFRRVIIQSAPVGISRHRNAVVRSARAMSRPPRDASVATLVEYQQHIERAVAWRGFAGQLPFGPEYGAAPLPAVATRDAAWRDCAARTDVLIGHTAEETGLYLPLLPVLRRIRRHRVLGRLMRALLIIPTTWIVYGLPLRNFSRRLARAGGNVTRYRYRWASPESTTGPAHMSELVLLLGSTKAWAGTVFASDTQEPESVRLGRLMRAHWATFARTGNIASHLTTESRSLIRFTRAQSRR
nr:carboxylesterase family protein [Mycetocola sp. JXN-3]